MSLLHEQNNSEFGPTVAVLVEHVCLLVTVPVEIALLRQQRMCAITVDNGRCARFAFSGFGVGAISRQLVRGVCDMNMPDMRSAEPPMRGKQYSATQRLRRGGALVVEKGRRSFG